MSVARREGLPTIFPNDSNISPKGTKRSTRAISSIVYLYLIV
jgi:hypothetical protein